MLSMSFLFLKRAGVYVGVYVCVYTRAHCTYEVVVCEPRGRDGTSGGPK